jgi:hypothetical protein
MLKIEVKINGTNGQIIKTVVNQSLSNFRRIYENLSA